MKSSFLALRYAIATSVFFLSIEAFASSLACDRLLGVGEVIMGAPVTISSERHITIQRGNVNLVSTIDSYVPGEELRISITGSPLKEVIIETSDGKFINGGCLGSRSLSWTSDLFIPIDVARDIQIFAGNG